jgi:hypothetical protein
VHAIEKLDWKSLALLVFSAVMKSLRTLAAIIQNTKRSKARPRAQGKTVFLA